MMHRYVTSQRSSNIRKRTYRNARRKLVLESLEVRQLLAVSTWAADITGDGAEELVSFSTGAWKVNSSPTTGSSGQILSSWSNLVTWQNLNVGDFNADGKQDIVGRELVGWPFDWYRLYG